MASLSSVQGGGRAFEPSKFLEQRGAVDAVVVKIARRILDYYLVLDEWRGESRVLFEHEVSSMVDSIAFHMEKEPDLDLYSEVDRLIQEQPDGSRDHLLEQFERGVIDYVFQSIDPGLLRQ